MERLKTALRMGITYGELSIHHCELMELVYLHCLLRCLVVFKVDESGLSPVVEIPYDVREEEGAGVLRIQI